MLSTRRSQAMKYVLLIHHGDAPTPHDPEAWAAVPDEEKAAIAKGYQDLNRTPGVTPGTGLREPATATTVRVDGGRTLVTDGPFVGIKEALGGWLTVEADDLDAAIELASRIPAARLGGAIEIRPVHEW
jgi:hypothetical protein